MSAIWKYVGLAAVLFGGWSFGQTMPSGAWVGPREILIIRHGEKPVNDDPRKVDPNLAERGYQRAGALVGVIPEHFARPDFIFATHKTGKSNRPVETVTPLAKALHEPIDDSFKDDDVAGLAHEVLTDPKFAGKTVLIAWHHGKIPELAHALGATGAPEEWDSTVFDRVWEIDLEGGKVGFKDLPEKALAGDSGE